MFNLHFDPITTGLLVVKKKKELVVVPSDDATGISATIGSIAISNEFKLLDNNLKIIDSIEISDSGSIDIRENGFVEII